MFLFSNKTGQFLFQVDYCYPFLNKRQWQNKQFLITSPVTCSQQWGLVNNKFLLKHMKQSANSFFIKCSQLVLVCISSTAHQIGLYHLSDIGYLESSLFNRLILQTVYIYDMMVYPACLLYFHSTDCYSLKSFPAMVSSYIYHFLISGQLCSTESYLPV